MKNVIIAGYGTFITDALETISDDMTAKQYYWDVKVKGFSEVKGWKRILLPRDTHPYIIKDSNSSVLMLVTETNKKNLKLIDDAEGYPYHYDRITVDTEFGEAFVYVPRDHVLETIMKRLEECDIKEDEWLNWISRSVRHNKTAMKIFPELLDIGEPIDDRVIGDKEL
ncbi:MAG: gamma-glutamylcyclotransferase family protein [Candidatus Thorarchaeota archaeon]